MISKYITRLQKEHQVHGDEMAVTSAGVLSNTFWAVNASNSIKSHAQTLIPLFLIPIILIPERNAVVSKLIQESHWYFHADKCSSYIGYILKGMGKNITLCLQQTMFFLVNTLPVISSFMDLINNIIEFITANHKICIENIDWSDNRRWDQWKVYPKWMSHFLLVRFLTSYFNCAFSFYKNIFQNKYKIQCRAHQKT